MCQEKALWSTPAYTYRHFFVESFFIHSDPLQRFSLQLLFLYVLELGVLKALGAANRSFLLGFNFKKKVTQTLDSVATDLFALCFFFHFFELKECWW